VVSVRVVALHTYPIKGGTVVDHDRVAVEPWGLAGDRRWMVVDSEGEAITQREAPDLTAVRPAYRAGGGLVICATGRPDLDAPEPSGTDLIPVSIFRQPLRATYAGAAAQRWFSDLLGRDARLVWLDDPTRRPVYRDRDSPERVNLADGFPVSLANTASLDAVNDWLRLDGSPEGPVPMRRFRPNVVVSGAPAWAEDGWTGGQVRIGEVTFRVPEPIGRCVVTTTDQETGERGDEPLRILGRHRKHGRKLLFATNLVPEAPGVLAVGDLLEAL
jgi:uncharacterized protein YcbX